MTKMLEYALIAFNQSQRDDAAPVSETTTTDELSSMVSAMVDAGILADDKAVTVWRRSITQGADVSGKGRYQFAVESKHGKALRKTGWTADPELMDPDDDE